MSSLPDEIKFNIQTLYSDFLTKKELRPRLGQKQMIAEVAKVFAALDEENLPGIGCIEAGTGTGKTLAYLVGALPITLQRHETLVISTATVSLQSQLVEKDLPDLIDATGIMLTWALAKGRRRYLCPIRLEVALDTIEGSDTVYPDELALVLEYDDQKMVTSLSKAWASGEWLGDMDQISETLTESVRLALTTDHHRCHGRSCRSYNTCPYFRERETWSEADILIVNHDLLISDIKLGGGVILPPLESITLVIDEAHQLPRVASDQFTENVRVAQSLGAIKTVDRVCKLIHGHLSNDHRLQKELNALPKQLEDLGYLVASWGRGALDALTELDADAFTYQSGGSRYRLSLSERFSAPESASEPPKATLARLQKIQDWLKQISLGEIGAVSQTDAELLSQQLGAALGRLESIPQVARAFSEVQQTHTAARWVRVGQDFRYSTPDDPTDIEFWVSPLTPANSLIDALWGRVRRAILTSATLTHRASFESITESLGILRYQSLIVEGIFHYGSQGRLVISKFAGDPRDEEKHADRIAKYLDSKVETNAGVLVLFTSWRLLNRVEELLPDELRSAVLVQGQTSISHLIRLHERRRSQSELSIIFGLQSMAEGIDLPGDLANEVVITRLPFKPPDDPRDATQAEYLRSLGRDPFTELSLPQATIRLRQAVGRLIRSESDTGQVTVLDCRLVNTAWGRSLIKELPSFEFFKE